MRSGHLFMADERRPVRFVDLLRALTTSKVDFIVVGGVAAVLEGSPVSTFDLDVVYENSDANVRRLVEALAALDAIYVDPAGRTVRPDPGRLRRGGHHLFRTRFGRLDVLATVGEGRAYEDLLEGSGQHVIHGMAVSVLGLETLIATKEEANRSKDRAVLDLLRETLEVRRRSEGD